MRMLDKALPVVVPQFVTHVADQRPIGFVHPRAHAFTVRVVGLGHVQCDQAVLMPGGHLRAAVRSAQQVEHHPPFGILGHPRLHRQSEGEQLRHDRPLGVLHLGPQHVVAGHRDVGDGPHESAIATQRLACRLVNGHQPVARGPRSMVGTSSIDVLRHTSVVAHDRHRPPTVSIGAWLERAQQYALRVVAERRLAMQTDVVAEKNGTAALARESAARAGQDGQAHGAGTVKLVRQFQGREDLALTPVPREGRPSPRQWKVTGFSLPYWPDLLGWTVDRQMGMPPALEAPPNQTLHQRQDPPCPPSPKRPTTASLPISLRSRRTALDRRQRHETPTARLPRPHQAATVTRHSRR